MQGEQSAFVGRELAEQRFDFIRGAASSRIATRIDGLGFGQVAGNGRRFNGPALAHDLAAKIIAAGVAGDAHEPVGEGLLAAPVGQTLDHPQERVLDEVIQIGARFDEAPQQSRDCRLVAFDKNFHGRAVAIFCATGEFGVGIGRSDCGNRGGFRFMRAIRCIV